jgi:hypothetical protein
MDAEYQACGEAAREGMSLLKGFRELAQVSSDFPLAGPLIIQSDINAALSLCLERKEGQRAKHIDVIHHFVSGEGCFRGASVRVLKIRRRCQ